MPNPRGALAAVRCRITLIGRDDQPDDTPERRTTRRELLAKEEELMRLVPENLALPLDEAAPS